MEQIKKFLRSRGFTLALLACLVAAAAAGVWAVRTVRDELKKSYDDLTTPQEEPAPEPQLTKLPVRRAHRDGNRNRSICIWKNSTECVNKAQETYNITAFFMKRSFLCSILYSVDRSKEKVFRQKETGGVPYGLQLQWLRSRLHGACHDLG